MTRLGNVPGKQGSPNSTGRNHLPAQDNRTDWPDPETQLATQIFQGLQVALAVTPHGKIVSDPELSKPDVALQIPQELAG